MTGRRWTVVVQEDGRRVLCRGWRVPDILREAGYKPQWFGAWRAWGVDSKHTADVVAAFERRGARVSLNGSGIPRGQYDDTINDWHTNPGTTPRTAPGCRHGAR